MLFALFDFYILKTLEVIEIKGRAGKAGRR